MNRIKTAKILLDVMYYLSLIGVIVGLFGKVDDFLISLIAWVIVYYIRYSFLLEEENKRLKENVKP